MTRLSTSPSSALSTRRSIRANFVLDHDQHASYIGIQYSVYLDNYYKRVGETTFDLHRRKFNYDQLAGCECYGFSLYLMQATTGFFGAKSHLYWKMNEGLRHIYRYFCREMKKYEEGETISKDEDYVPETFPKVYLHDNDYLGNANLRYKLAGWTTASRTQQGATS